MEKINKIKEHIKEHIKRYANHNTRNNLIEILNTNPEYF
jgi:ribosomal protein S15P/S13E